ncbi:NAD(P)/FAD-dependent oxidoreductase [Oscillospiraceae bacterium HV4-5-C5C]|nr:NAD(P)/FAD-dependent oxidoreductase [Oscillospiraceae bacterium HV4-5-C5C]
MLNDLIIIGAGPAGSSAAIYAASRGISVRLLEQQAVGGLIGQVSTVTHYAAIAAHETGAGFARRLQEQLAAAKVEVCVEAVHQVALTGPVKTVRTAANTYQARAVILANGSTPNRLDIPGEAELDGHGMNLNAARDGRAYAGHNLYVVGGADGAIKEALYLAQYAHKLVVVHFEDQLGAIPQFVTPLLQLSNLELRLHTRLSALEGKQAISRLQLTDVHSGESHWYEDPGAGVFVYAGSTPNTTLYPELKLEKGYIPVNEKMETSLPGVYAAGDIRVKQVRQIATAVADGAVAGINAAAYVKSVTRTCV